MEFNSDNRKVLHFGDLNHSRTLTVNSRALRNIAEQRDLGVQVHNSLEVMPMEEKCG